jgi:hypothetical protein
MLHLIRPIEAINTKMTSPVASPFSSGPLVWLGLRAEREPFLVGRISDGRR